MFISKILKKGLLIITIVVFTISINIIIQQKIQDVKSQKANDNLLKIITKNEEKKETKVNGNKVENVEKITELSEEIECKVQENNNEKEKIQEQINIEKQKIKPGVAITNIENTKDKIDWNKLEQINRDIVGWIEIPNTNINYPILKDENLYYLNHDYEGKINRNGSIFIRNYNLFESEEITIYGHNMKNGTMFAKLAQYINKDFLESNSKFYIYTKEDTYEGNIFAAYSKGVNEEKEAIKSLNFEERLNYYENEGRNVKKLDNNVSKIVKLITCSYINAKKNPTDQRYYVIAEIRKID